MSNDAMVKAEALSDKKFYALVGAALVTIIASLALGCQVKASCQWGSFEISRPSAQNQIPGLLPMAF